MWPLTSRPNALFQDREPKKILSSTGSAFRDVAKFVNLHHFQRFHQQQLTGFCYITPFHPVALPPVILPSSSTANRLVRTPNNQLGYNSPSQVTRNTKRVRGQPPTTSQPPPTPSSQNSAHRFVSRFRQHTVPSTVTAHKRSFKTLLPRVFQLPIHKSHSSQFGRAPFQLN